MFKVTKTEEDGRHIWSSATAVCDLAQPRDALVGLAVEHFRSAYGEDAIVRDAEKLLPSDIADGVFKLDALRAAVRAGMTDPARDGGKPVALRVTRSQAAEFVAKCAFRQLHGYSYPAHPQSGCANANQPVLGFDGWGYVSDTAETPDLVLVQVKATDDAECPPKVATELAAECARAPNDRGALARALSVIVHLARDEAAKRIAIRLLEALGADRPIRVVVAAAIVRGITISSVSDLDPVRVVAKEYATATGHGVSLTIGVDLHQFGQVVTDQARAA